MDLATVTSYIQLLSAFLVSITAFVAALIGLIKPVRRWFTNLFKAYNNSDVNKRIDLVDSDVKKINEFIDNVGDQLKEKFERDQKEQMLTKEAIKAILRNQMLAIYNRSEERGYIGDWDRDNFEQLFSIYTELGGNSYMHTVNTKILMLPRVPKTRKKTKKK